MRRAIWVVGVGLLAGCFFSAAASARCVRDIAESGAVGVRCSDGVRGRLAGDEIPPANPTTTYRPSNSSRNSRSDNSALPSNGNSSPYQVQSGDSASRANDSAAGALARQRTAGAGSANDRRPY